MLNVLQERALVQDGKPQGQLSTGRLMALTDLGCQDGTAIL